jgi:hypothetical protein
MTSFPQVVVGKRGLRPNILLDQVQTPLSSPYMWGTLRNVTTPSPGRGSEARHACQVSRLFLF